MRQRVLGDFIHFRVSPTLHAQLQAHCARAGVKPTTFVRGLVERELQAVPEKQQEEVVTFVCGLLDEQPKEVTCLT